MPRSIGEERILKAGKYPIKPYSGCPDRYCACSAQQLPRLRAKERGLEVPPYGPLVDDPEIRYAVERQVIVEVNRNPRHLQGWGG